MMAGVSSVWRTLGAGPVRDIIAVVVATGFVGVSYGAIAIAAGVPPWAVIAFSIFVFAGGSQFLAVSLVAAGNPFAAIFGGLLLNARHFPFGFTVADVLSRSRAGRLVGAHVMVDEAVAFALAQPDAPKRRAAYWLTGAGIFVCWQIGTVLGAWLGSTVSDPARYGLDAAFPAALLALIIPRLREAAGLRVALVAAVVSVATTFVLPAGLPVLLGLAGLVAAGRSPRPVHTSAAPPTNATGDSA